MVEINETEDLSNLVLVRVYKKLVFLVAVTSFVDYFSVFSSLNVCVLCFYCEI